MGIFSRLTDIINANIGLDGATATGSATLRTGGARPYIKADLKLSELDLNKYLHAGENGTSAGTDLQGDPSMEVAPNSVFVCSKNASSTSWAPQRSQLMLVHTWTRCRPTGRLLYIV